MTDGRPIAAGCVDPETLAAFMDGRLEPRERAAVEAHLAECEDCYETWMESRTVAAETTSVARDDRNRRTPLATWIIWSSSIAAGMALMIYAVQSLRTPSDRPELYSLVAAVGNARSVEARLTGGFRWGPIPAVTRSSASRQTSPEVTIASARLEQQLQADRNPETLAAYASGQIALAVPQSLDDAIASLKEATALSPDNAYYWSDLAAAYYSRYQLRAMAVDIPSASQAVESALKLNPDLIEAKFNRALILEKLGQVENALRAWREYLALDSGSPWATEAREHINRLERSAASERETPKASALRERLFDLVLREWATAGPERTGLILAEAESITRNLGKYPDALAEHVVRGIRESRAPQLEIYRAGLRAYGAGRAHYLVNQYAEAERQFTNAAKALTSAGSPLASAAATHLAAIEYLGGQLEGAKARLWAVQAETRDRPYLTVHARVDWLLGLISMVQGDYERAESHYESAASLFERAGELDNYGFMQILLAERFEWSGDIRRAWTARLSGLPLSRRSGSLLEAARAARNSGFRHTAVIFEQDAVELSRDGSRPLDLADALRHSAISLAGDGQHSEASTLIEEARALLDSNDPNWDRMKAELDLAAAWSTDQSRAHEALQAVERALAYFTKARADGRLPEILLARAHLKRLSSEFDAARHDLDRGLGLLDRQLTTVLDPQLRATFGDQFARLGDERILVELAAGDPAAAWQAAERSRTWSSGASRGVAPSVLELAQAQALLPKQAAALYMAVAGEKLHLWCIRHDSFAYRNTPIAKLSIDRLVEAFRSSMASLAVGTELRRLLIDPMVQELADANTVVIVPDGSLHLIPFSALPGRQTQFLVEEHAIVVAQNLGIALRTSAGPRTSPRVVTAVGNPRLDRGRYPNLADLPNAGLEAEMVVRQYGHAARLISGSDATSGTVMATLAESDVIHLASHALINRNNPGLSALLLAGDSTVTADQIARSQLPRTQLVVLAACESADGELTRNGPLGLASAFLRAGVNSVVAGYWIVDDAASLSLFEVFYKNYSKTGNQVEALRVAQLELLRSGSPSLNHPRHWAAFGVFGHLGREALLTNGGN